MGVIRCQRHHITTLTPRQKRTLTTPHLRANRLPPLGGTGCQRHDGQAGSRRAVRSLAQGPPRQAQQGGCRAGCGGLLVVVGTVYCGNDAPYRVICTAAPVHGPQTNAARWGLRCGMTLSPIADGVMQGVNRIQAFQQRRKQEATCGLGWTVGCGGHRPCGYKGHPVPRLRLRGGRSAAKRGQRCDIATGSIGLHTLMYILSARSLGHAP